MSSCMCSVGAGGQYINISQHLGAVSPVNISTYGQHLGARSPISNINLYLGVSEYRNNLFAFWGTLVAFLYLFAIAYSIAQSVFVRCPTRDSPPGARQAAAASDGRP